MPCKTARRVAVLVIAVIALCALAEYAVAISSHTYLETVGHPAGGYNGTSIAGGDFDGDGYGDLVIGTPSYGVTGLAFVYLGGPRAPQSFSIVLYPASGSAQSFGVTCASAGDFNGDGYDDIMVGDYNDAASGGSSGHVDIFFGGPGLDGTADVSFDGPVSGGLFGYALAGGGDVDGDAYDDIVISEPGYASTGRVHLYRGGLGYDTVADAQIVGPVAGTDYGAAVAIIGDYNDDGLDDFAVGAPTGSFIAGYFGSRHLDVTADLSIFGDTDDDFGAAIAGVGDVDADGFDDFAVGGPNAELGYGLVYVKYGAPDGFSLRGVTLPGQIPNHGMGTSVAAAGDVDHDGYDDILVGSYAFPVGSIGNAGRADLFLGGSALSTTPTLSWFGTGADRLGTAVTGVGDMDGDGYPDVAFSAPYDDEGGTARGRIWVEEVFPYQILAPSPGTRLVAGKEAVVRWRGHDRADVSTSVDGHTWIEVAHGVGGDDENTLTIPMPDVVTDAASIRITYTGRAAGPGTSRTVGPLRLVRAVAPPAIAQREAVSLSGTSGSSRFGESLVNAGDLNADGHDDFAVGAPQDDVVGSNAGAAFVFFGGPALDDVPDVVIGGPSSNDLFGTSVGAADVDADGHPDLLVGATEAAGGGSVFVYLGGPSFDGVADATFDGGIGVQRFGSHVGSAGDFNGDGFEDVAISESYDGSTYIYYGGPAFDTGYDADRNVENGVAAGDVDGDGYDDVVGRLDGNDDVYLWLGGASGSGSGAIRIDQPWPGDSFASAVSAGWDVNGDGRPDFVVGAPTDDRVGDDAGRAYVYLGAFDVSDVPALVIEGATGDETGAAVVLHPDLNGDGYADVVVGSPGSDAAGVDAGRIDVYFGGPRLDAIADVTMYGTPGDRLGERVAAGGDHVDDGFADLLTARPSQGSGIARLLDLNRYHLTAPTGGETWNVGAPVEVRWDGAQPADLELSLDGGSTYRSLVAGVGGAGANRVTVRVPHLPTRFAEVRVVPSDSAVSGEATTGASFTIDAAIALTRFAIDSRERETVISWATEPGPDAGVRYDVETRRGGAPWRTEIADATEGTLVLDGAWGSELRLTARNGLGEAVVLHEGTVRAPSALSVGPSPWRAGPLRIGFIASGFAGTDEHVTIAAYDVGGRRVATLGDGVYPVGAHTITWDGRDAHHRTVMPGVYFIRLTAPGRVRDTRVLRLP